MANDNLERGRPGWLVADRGDRFKGRCQCLLTVLGKGQNFMSLQLVVTVQRLKATAFSDYSTKVNNLCHLFSGASSKVKSL